MPLISLEHAKRFAPRIAIISELKYLNRPGMECKWSSWFYPLPCTIYPNSCKSRSKQYGSVGPSDLYSPKFAVLGLKMRAMQYGNA